MRNLTETEIYKLKDQNCSSENWKKINVPENFNPCFIQNVKFSGDITIGEFNKTISFPGGYEKHSGIYNCFIHNCVIGNDCYISNVNTLSNYHIGNDVIIENVNTLVVTGENSFGNGTDLEILNEGGGRELKIYDKLTAQIAYLMVLYRHDKELINKLNYMIDEYVKTKLSDVGKIADGCRIINCVSISNVNAGSHTALFGIAKLNSGTIVSCKEAPVFVGTGVSANNFIIQSGSKIDNYVILDKCFVGQGVNLGKQYSAENSAFFANCEGFHGEAVALFAGPYTVTHHKSSLLIAGLFSFYNAGSGTNQSNHMYKLGPLHQGILERGSKTGSFSYMLWPSRVGAFSAVLGKHYTNFDSSDMPFSYISEEHGKSILTPAMNLLTVGTKRDSEKWRARDRRKDPEKLDLINFDLFNPYTVGKMIKASEILNELYNKTPKDQEFVSYNGLQINRLMLRTAVKYYEMGIKIYIGKVLSSQLEKIQTGTFEEFKLSINLYSKNYDKWIDLAGLFISAHTADLLMERISSGEFKTISELKDELKRIFDNYSCEEWEWAANLIEKRLNKKIAELTKEDFTRLINEWKDNSVKLNNMIAKDAMREFDPLSKIGFGIDGGIQEIDADFEAVRGNYESNKFIKQLQTENKETEKKSLRYLNLINSYN